MEEIERQLRSTFERLVREGLQNAEMVQARSALGAVAEAAIITCRVLAQLEHPPGH